MVRKTNNSHCVKNKVKTQKELLIPLVQSSADFHSITFNNFHFPRRQEIPLSFKYYLRQLSDNHKVLHFNKSIMHVIDCTFPPAWILDHHQLQTSYTDKCYWTENEKTASSKSTN